MKESHFTFPHVDEPPRGSPITQSRRFFFHFHAFTQSMKNWDFHAKTLKLDENTPFTKSRMSLNDFTKSRTFFDAFTHHARKSIHAITQK